MANTTVRINAPGMHRGFGARFAADAFPRPRVLLVP